MLLHVGMVGRALERDVERDLDARARAPRATRRRKSSSVPSSGWIALCPPSAAPIAQGLPTSSGSASSALLRPLRLLAADRMDRRQVQHVEAHRGDVRQARLDVAEGAVRGRARAAVERGNSSYQLLKRARSRSTTSGSSAA